MTFFCTIAYGSTERERRCGRVAVTECVDVEPRSVLAAAGIAVANYCVDIAMTFT